MSGVEGGSAKRAVRTQFGRQASQYTTSGVHRHSEGLEILLRLAAPSPGDRALDVATGVGFTALALAPGCRAVVALDMTPNMLREARALRAERGITNLAFCAGDAEAIPFAGGAFDLVTCRHAAHHFPALSQALREMARVLRPGGRVVFDDTCAPEEPAVEAVMNDWELRRDPSHVANHPPSRLRRMLEHSGLAVREAVMTRVPLMFDDWVRRAGVPEDRAAALRRDMLQAPPAVREALQVRETGGDVAFAWPEVVVLGIKE